MLNGGRELTKSANLMQRANGYLIIGSAYFHLNQIDNSIVYSKCAIDCNSNLVDPYYNIANALKLKGRLHEAKDYLYKAIMIQPNFINAHFSYAHILTKLGLLNEALNVI
jgi:tetratricopeptide (TPR) repeat protein